MWQGARACWRIEGARALLFLLVCLVLGAPARAAPEPAAARLREAQHQVLPGGSFEVPQGLPVLDEARWQPTPLPLVLPRAVAPGGSKAIDTLWVRLTVPPQLRAGDPERLRLYLPRWQTVGQITIYADGERVFRSGAGPVWNGFNHPVWIPLARADSGRGAPATVLIRVDHLRTVGAALSTAWVGDVDALSARHRWRQLLQVELTYVGSAAFLTLGLLASLAWVSRREPLYGLFAFYAVCWFVRALHFHMGTGPLPLPEDWFGWLTVHSLSGLTVASMLFGIRLVGVRLPWLEWPCIGGAAFAAAASLPPLADAPALALVAPLAYLVMLVLFVLAGLATVVVAWRARARQGLVVLAMTVATMPLNVHDWLLQNYRVDIEHLYLQPFGMLILAGVFLGIVLQRHLAAVRHSERAQEELERQLRARENELRESHERLRAIERQQVLDRERQRLMQDMHDGLGSSLMGALKVAERDRDGVLAEVLRQCIDDLKLTIDSLEPVQSDLLLLLATLRFRLGTRLEQAGVQLHWEVDPLPPLPWLDPGSALHVLRILQEVLTNVVKHSQARQLRLTTALRGDEVVVTAADDGIGFDATAATGTGRGLANIRRRAQAIGARASWVAAGPGTRFELVLPLARAPEAEAPRDDDRWSLHGA